MRDSRAVLSVIFFHVFVTQYDKYNDVHVSMKALETFTRMRCHYLPDLCLSMDMSHASKLHHLVVRTGYVTYSSLFLVFFFFCM